MVGTLTSKKSDGIQLFCGSHLASLANRAIQEANGRMTPFPYLSESEAAKLLGLASGKGNAWRHLAEHAPHIPIVEVAGQKAVKRTDVEAWLANGRSAVRPGGNKDLAPKAKRRKLAAAIHKIKNPPPAKPPRKKQEADYHALAAKRSFQWIGETIPQNVCINTMWQCGEGHQWQSRYNTIRQGSNCPECSRLARKKNPPNSGRKRPPGETRRRVLRFIKQQNMHGIAPTLDEIAAAVGIASKSTAALHVTNLEQEGAIVREPDKPSSIQAVGQPTLADVYQWYDQQNQTTKEHLAIMQFPLLGED